MPFTRTVIALSLGLIIGQGHVQAAPLLSLDNAKSERAVATSNAWVEVNKAAFEKNIHTLQNTLTNKSRLCAVLKADAYGHGVGLLMPSIMKMEVPCVGVASNEEARIVRENGFKGELVRVRTATLAEVEGALPYKIEELVSSLDYARETAAIAEKHGRRLKVHLALNAGGMSRNGLEMSTEQGRQEALAITHLAHLELVGIMTHFAVQDKDDVRQGLKAFNEQTAWLIKTAGMDRSKITLHAANSYATLEVPESHLDMVRAGGALYGMMEPSHAEYKRVMQVKSYVASVNQYPKGNTVGYDRTVTLNRDSKLANIPVGYSDGYRRAFTNKGVVLIDGQRAPVVGKVSMNTLMVDVTDIPAVHAGDQVVLFGKQGDSEIAQSELEELSGTLLVDLATVWGSINPRTLVVDKVSD
ncbi:alanine racemase [Pseudomonas sp. H11T01]|uniref:alanine racemase n=1 Tax=Pseudomonas sp. H11T01 TaxID=3402749 RepID=UPI003AD22760